MKTSLKNHIFFAFIASISLGLAPFNEPHIFGKIKWVRGGAIGMKGMDWFDLFLHGTPWIYLFIVLGIFLFRKVKTMKR